MKKTLVVLSLVSLVFSLSGEQILAQDHSRRVSPAFPIGAGEKMIVYPGSRIVQSELRDPTTWGQTNSGERGILIELPVGTTIKRLLGDFVDQNGSANMTIRLIRLSNNDGTRVVMREFTSSGISSSNATDFQQIVANPLSHAMLQGWAYFITVEWPGGTSTDELIVGTIKLIYEP